MNIGVAGVGAGYFSQFHYESWARMSGVDLLAVADTSPAAAEATGAPAYGSAKEMIEAVQPDILDVIVPPHSQAEVIRAALESSVRLIICQKPFCSNIVEAREIVEAAKMVGIPVVIHENFRFQPWYRAIRTEIEKGQIGTVHQASFRLRPGDGQGPQAYLDRQPYFQKMERFLVRETAVHWIDTFRFLFGDPEAVYADLRRLNPVIAGEDAGYIVFDHPGGVTSVFDGNRHLDHAADNLRRTMGEALIEGTEGQLRLTGDGAVHLRKFGENSEKQVLGPDLWDGFGGDCVHALQSHVVSALRDGTPLENEAEDYLMVAETEQAIYTSAKEGRKVRLERSQ